MVGLAPGSLCIAAPGHETHRSLQAPLVRYAFEDLEVVGCTFRKEEHQSCRHQPNNNKTLFEEVNIEKKKALYLNVKVFSKKVLIGHTILTSPTGDRTAIFRVHQSHAKA